MEIEGLLVDPNDYELYKKIGEGYFSSIYVARNKYDGSLVAAKIIKTSDSFSDPNFQHNLILESTILRKLQHPSILSFIGLALVSFYDHLKSEATFIMEYCPKGTLKQMINNERVFPTYPLWTPTKKYISLLGIANGMDFIHRNGILHRDLKPNNVLLDQNLYPKIFDFGLSRVFDSSLDNSFELEMTCSVGTPIYMAPELIVGDKYGRGVDIYAFGIMAYEILTSIEPYSNVLQNMNSFRLMRSVIDGVRPRFPDGFNQKMKALISRCWDKKPSNRPSFRDIFEVLSTDFSYSDEDIDEEEVENYIEMINNFKY